MKFSRDVVISKKLKNLFLIGIILWIIHGIEELATGFYNIDSHVLFVFSFVKNMTPMASIFLTFQIMFWLALIVSYFMIKSPKWQLRMMIVPGIIMVYELHHFYKAIIVGGYYPGLISALAFPIIGFFFWRELLRIYKK